MTHSWIAHDGVHLMLAVQEAILHQQHSMADICTFPLRLQEIYFVLTHKQILLIHQVGQYAANKTSGLQLDIMGVYWLMDMCISCRIRILMAGMEWCCAIIQPPIFLTRSI